MLGRIKHAEKKKYRDLLVKLQGGKCPLCGRSFKVVDPVLDHDHITGELRGVLCRNCNAMEGKITGNKGAATRASNKLEAKNWLRRLVNYFERSVPSVIKGKVYPSFKTDLEKRTAINKKARNVYKAKKRLTIGKIKRKKSVGSTRPTPSIYAEGVPTLRIKDL